jgi:hypothetical protein
MYILWPRRVGKEKNARKFYRGVIFVADVYNPWPALLVVADWQQETYMSEVWSRQYDSCGFT